MLGAIADLGNSVGRRGEVDLRRNGLPEHRLYAVAPQRHREDLRAGKIGGAGVSLRGGWRHLGTPAQTRGGSVELERKGVP